MDLVGVVIVGVAAFGAGTGLGLWLRRDAALRPRHDRSGRGRAGGVAAPTAPRTLQAIDTLVADSITRLAGWVRPGATPSGPAGIRLGADGTLSLLFSDIAGSTRLNRQPAGGVSASGISPWGSRRSRPLRDGSGKGIAPSSEVV